tara:strand:- start:1204 stop:2382 length:1179 start_codon:yes stop_codon:yes gene_type:complete
MNKVLMRPIFKIKYVRSHEKNKFNKGGIANVLHFQEGGLSQGERTALKLQPFVSALLGAQRMPGESAFSPVARAVGQGFAGLPDNLKTIAAIDESYEPEEKETYRRLTKEEVESGKFGDNLDPSGNWQINESTGELKNLATKKLFADPFKSALAPKLAEDYTNTIQAGATAQGKLGDLEILEALVGNPDLTLGQFGPLTQNIQRFVVGLGADEKGLTDLTAAEVLQRFAGKSVLADLGQLKGALSEKELAFIQSLNIGVDTPREAAVMLVQLYKKASEKAIAKAKLYNEHVAAVGNPLTPDSNGLTLFQKNAKLDADFQILSPEFEDRLAGLSGTKSSSKFDRKTITVSESNIDKFKQLYPGQEISIGQKYEVREVTQKGGKVKKFQLIPVN